MNSLDFVLSAGSYEMPIPLVAGKVSSSTNTSLTLLGN